MNKSGAFKVAVVGCGQVGMTAAYAMMLSGTPTEIVLVDRNKDKAMGEKLDLEHALSLLNTYVNIVATDAYEDLAGASLVVYTAGVSQKPGETRLDLINTNKKILEELLPKIMTNAPEANILMVANPVDILTYYAHKLFPNSGGKIFGTGTMLDTARFRFHLSEILKINPHSIHTYILGEHGDSSFPVYANTTVGGQKLLEISELSVDKIDEAYEKTRTAAYKIIESKGATYYAIGVVVMKIMQAIFSDARTVYPLSVPLENYLEVSGIAMSVPCVLGEHGVAEILKIDLSESEKEKFMKSAGILKEFTKNL